jgi:hypothetical protein
VDDGGLPKAKQSEAKQSKAKQSNANQGRGHPDQGEHSCTRGYFWRRRLKEAWASVTDGHEDGQKSAHCHKGDEACQTGPVLHNQMQRMQRRCRQQAISPIVRQLWLYASFPRHVGIPDLPHSDTGSSMCQGDSVGGRSYVRWAFLFADFRGRTPAPPCLAVLVVRLSEISKGGGGWGMGDGDGGWRMRWH